MSRPPKKKSTKSFTQRASSWMQAHPYWASYLIGFAYFAGVISWMFTIKTAEIAQGIAIKLVALASGIIMVSSLALGFVIFVWLARQLRIKLSESRAVWQLPMLWVVSEYARAVIFSVISLGPDGRIGPYWTFGDLGYYLAGTPLAFMARFGGLYLLSAVVIALAVAGYQSWHRRSWLPITPLVGGLAILSLLGWTLYLPANGQSITVGAVNYPTKDTPTTNSSDTYPIFANMPGRSLDTLVLPEYSHYYEDNMASDKLLIQSLMKYDDGLVIHSAREGGEGLGHNMLTFQTAGGEVLNQQKKWFVIPAGEYVPYLYQVILAYAGQERLLMNFNAQKSVNRGEEIEQPYTYKGIRYGAHACSGVIAPDFYNQLAMQGADIFTNSAALDTMGISPLFHLEGEQMNRLAAVAHAKPFVQSAKGGPAYIIDKDGRRLAKTYTPNGGVVMADVQTNQTKTLYGWLGDWIVYVSIVGTAYLFIRQFLTRQRRPVSKSGKNPRR